MRTEVPFAISLLVLAGCPTDVNVKRFLVPPEVAIETPVEGASIYEAVPVLMRGRVTDEAYQSSLSTITATWAVNGARVCAGTVVDVNGIIECETVFEKGAATVSLVAVNPDGQTASAVVELVITENTAPTAEIVSPVAGTEYFAEDLIVFEGLVGDGESQLDNMTVEWTSSIDGVLAFPTSPGSDGKTQGSSPLSIGDHQITLTVTDTTGRTGSDITTIEVLAGNKPTIELVSPVSGDIANLDDSVRFEAWLDDVEDYPEDLSLSWESDLDGVFSTQPASSDGVASFNYAGLSRGNHTITVYATDSDGMSSQDSATLFINGVPEAPSVHIEPDPATSSDPLTVMFDAESFDPDGDSIRYEYQWYRNGVATTNVSNPLPAAETTRGDVWMVYVTPDDGSSLGPSANASITVQNSPPTMTGVTITPPNAYTDDTLSAVAAGFYDDDGDPQGWRYRWALNGTTIAGATDPTLASSYFVKGDSLTVTAWPNDSFEDGSPMTSAAKVIQNSTPTVPFVNVTPDNPEREDSLDCAYSSSDADADTITYTVSWTKDGAPTGIVDTTIDASLTENGETWTCLVTASDGTATSVAGSDFVVVSDYVNMPPEAPTIHIEPDPAQSDESLTAVIDVDSYDLDGDTITYAYVWYVDGVDSGIVSETVPASDTLRGEIWTVVVSPYDGYQYGSTESASVQIVNTPPTLASASISPTTAYTDTLLTAVPSGYTDDDGDAATYRYQWYLGGNRILGAVDSTLAETNFVRGDVIYAEVSPWDGTDLGASVTTGSITIQNAPPTTPTVTVSPDTPEREQDLACTYSSTDADNDAITYSLMWTKNGAVTGITTATLDDSLTENGETWACLVSATDGTATSATGSDSVLVYDYINVAPEAPIIHISPDPAKSNETLSAIIDSGSFDLDGDTVSYAYEWFRNGATTGITSSTVSASQTSKGETWTVIVTPNDGRQNGATASDWVDIGNTAPTLTSASISPTTAYTDTTLTAVPSGFYDDDGDPAAYLYQWYKGGVAISGATTGTLVGTYFSKGETLYVLVTPWDGTSAGTTVNSGSLTIQNSTPTTPTVNVTPDTPEREDSLSCTYSSTDADSDSISYSLSWTKNGSPTTVTGSTVDSALTENGETWACWITATDGTATSATGTDAVVVNDYVNVAPTAPTIHIDPDPARSDQALTAIIDAASYDLDGDTVTYAYAWYRDGVASGVTSATLAASYTSKGQAWSVIVTPNDGRQNGSTATDSIVIGNTPPTLSSVLITPTTAYTNDTLTATPSGFSDDDGDAASYTYQWYLGGVAISGATGSTLAGTYFSRGNVITVAVVPRDGVDSGSSVTSSSLTISNSTPSTPSVDVTPNLPENSSTLSCGISAASSDADSDSLSYVYRWTFNGAASSVTTSTVASSYTSIGETWACYVKAYDGTTYSSEGSDSSYVSDYTAPSAPVLSTLVPYRNETSATVLGTSEASATITLYVSCGSGTSTRSTTASGAGTFGFVEAPAAGTSCSYYATATDAYGNVSAASNVVSTEVCDPADEYETSTSYGDSCSVPVVDWSTLSDAGTTTLSFSGNILDSSDSDWYLVETSDLTTAGINYYRFHIEMLAGSSEYGFQVYDGGCGSAYLECNTVSSYSEYEYYAQDKGEGHTIPSDTRSCYNSTGGYNNCDDLSSDYYINVFRKTTAYSCQEYTLEITNGQW